MHLPDDVRLSSWCFHTLVSNAFLFQQSFECRFYLSCFKCQSYSRFQIDVLVTFHDTMCILFYTHSSDSMLCNFMCHCIDYYQLPALQTIRHKQNTVHSVLTTASLDSTVHNCGSIRLRECLVEYEQSNRKGVRLEWRTPKVWKSKTLKTTVENAHNIRKTIPFFYYVAVGNATTRE